MLDNSSVKEEDNKKTIIIEPQINRALPTTQGNVSKNTEEPTIENKVEQKDALAHIFKTEESACSLLNDIRILVPRSPKFGSPHNIEVHGPYGADENISSEAQKVIIESERAESTVESVCSVSEGGLKKKSSVLDKIRNLFEKEEQEIEKYDHEIHGQISHFSGLEGYEEIEHYWVKKPYNFVVILFNAERNNHLYYVVEPELTYFEKRFH
ncbi:hypothetical protein Metho_1055 [Methanomethylovorans hollandica DSM 15978]|uniref:PilB3-like N-terminal domain-containing protein n=1 Tax=Methanomethylovorans hollandica (strain DSM 15978 / NBRC 107637 / DMS1) TaxID=867904 RepID=L0KW04_METHD|nr:hypothetical protein [Methanomethylovorans hollandica]AGB49291.1 hypothetical protein Metho_1055 [Methanomethylovorans hollandica DSM 15978]